MNDLMQDKRFIRYIYGFLGSLILTFVAYYLATERNLPFNQLGIILAITASAQLILQLFFFLHFSEGKGTKHAISALLYTTLTVFAVVAGSIWIMNNLHYNMMPQHHVEQEIIKDEGYDQR